MMISLARNRLLAALPEQDFERLTVGLGSVHLCLGDILYHAGEEIRYVYFPEQGLISLVATMMDGATVETGIVGNEGMMGVPVLLCASSAPYRAIVHVEGQAWRMRADAFKYEMLSGGALRKRLLLYTQALMTQMSQMAACNCLHTVEERLCSLLLMIDDRMDSNEFFLTHEMIAEMWGCECYRTIKMEFDRLFEIEAESEFEKAPPAPQWAGQGLEDRRSRIEDRGTRYSV